jgi:hypothetical protein
MMTIDQILLDIVNNTNPTVEEYLLKRDARVLRSLASIVSNTTFITENQGRLLLKIIQDNQEKIPANPYPSITRPSTLFRLHKGAQALPMRPMNKLLIYSLKGEQKDN